MKARQRISTMEGVLERAVSNGAENLLRQVRTVMPDPPMLSGVPKVRGFRLDGYGVFFDVEVPALRLPVTWPLRYLIEDNRAAVAAALAELRTMIADQPARERDRFETLARRLESRAVTPRTTPRQADPVVTEPDVAYTKAVREVAHRRDDREQRSHAGRPRRMADGCGPRQRPARSADARRHGRVEHADLPREGLRPGGVPRRPHDAWRKRAATSRCKRTREPTGASREPIGRAGVLSSGQDSDGRLQSGHARTLAKRFPDGLRPGLCVGRGLLRARVKWRRI